MRRLALLAVVILTLAACSSPQVPQPSPTATPAPIKPTPSSPTTRVVGYFTDWSVYGPDFQVKNLETSGSADHLTDIVYAFGDVKGGTCEADDPWADYLRPVGAKDSLDGKADPTSGSSLRGNFRQLRLLKAAHPNLRLIWSFGGWNGSAGFTDAVKDPATFAASCKSLLEDKRWPGLFDGIDVDWEYPNACGLQCDTSGKDALSTLLSALRGSLGTTKLITAAISGDSDKLSTNDYAKAAESANWFNAMTYDYFGTGADGPGDDSSDLTHVEPHSPLTAFPGIPRKASTTEAGVDALLKTGVPASKVLLGIGFYGRGWTGVTSPAAGSTASGPANGTYEKGIENYSILAERCPPTGTIGGTAYGFCDGQWWSYDTPATIAAKMAYARSKGLGGAFAWELSGDTAQGSLLAAMAAGDDAS